MDETLDNEMRLVTEFVNENVDEAAGCISSAMEDVNDSSYVYYKLCTDVFCEVLEISKDEKHLFRVLASGEIEEGFLRDTQDGKEPDQRCHKVEFQFFVDKDEEGEFYIDFYRDENGEIDVGATIIEPESEE